MASRDFEWSWIFQRIKRPKSDVLDVGCIRMKKLQGLTHWLLHDGHKVTGVDLGGEGIEIENWPNLTYIESDILNCDFPDHSFDYITASHVLQHIGLGFWGRGNPMKSEKGDYEFMKKSSKWLKPEGSIFLVISIAKEFHDFKYSGECTYRVYSNERLAGILAHAALVIKDSEVFDGAHCSRERIKGAKAIVLEAGKL